MPRLLEEPRGQRNPSEERKINEAAERRRREEDEARARRRLEEYAEMMSHIQ